MLELLSPQRLEQHLLPRRASSSCTSEHWQDKESIKPASKVDHKVELDHRLVLDVPDGVPEYGWVPISVAELHEDSTGNGVGIDGGFLHADW